MPIWNISIAFIVECCFCFPELLHPIRIFPYTERVPEDARQPKCHYLLFQKLFERRANWEEIG